jgi:hypothetical protein
MLTFPFQLLQLILPSLSLPLLPKDLYVWVSWDELLVSQLLLQLVEKLTPLALVD